MCLVWSFLWTITKVSRPRLTLEPRTSLSVSTLARTWSSADIHALRRSLLLYLVPSYLAVTINNTFWMCGQYQYHHHHHHDVKCSAKSSRHYSHLPEWSILSQLQGLSCCDTRVMADLVNPGGGWLATGTSPFLWWPLTISHLGAGSIGNTNTYVKSITNNNLTKYWCSSIHPQKVIPIRMKFGVWVDSDSVSYDPIKGQVQGHESFKVGFSSIFRICLPRHLQW